MLRSVDLETYLAAPCASLPLPYAVCGGSACGGLRIAGEGIPVDLIKEAEADDNAFRHTFYRLSRELGDMRRYSSDTHSARQLFAGDAEDAALIADIAARCGSKIDLEAFASSPFFNERLCVAVHERASGECRAAGLALYDGDMREGWLYRLFIPGEYLGTDAAALLVSELLRRMPAGAQFATANVSLFNKGLVRLLRKRGFSGGDLWVFPVKKPRDTHIIDE